MFTEEQFKALPCLRTDARIKLVGIHLHRSLAGSPFTIECSGGHFRVPRVLVPLAKKAIEGLPCYDGPDEGAVNELLRRVAECDPRAEPSDAPCDDLAAAISGIVDEAGAELRARVVEAARAQPVDRAALVTEAMRILAGG